MPDASDSARETFVQAPDGHILGVGFVHLDGARMEIHEQGHGLHVLDPEERHMTRTAELLGGSPRKDQRKAVLAIGVIVAEGPARDDVGMVVQ
ncbi:hypothetical protein ACXNSR_03080 [Streptomyces sp. NC-S4]